MSTRTRLITAQAGVVCVLVAVVYVIFLSPDGEGPLTGIEAPRPSIPRHAPSERGQEPRPKPDRKTPLTAPAPPAASLAPPTPADVEYNDSVAQLRALLRSGEQ